MSLVVYFLGNSVVLIQVPQLPFSGEYIIMYMEGWTDDIWFYDSDLNYSLDQAKNHKLCGYKCKIVKIGEVKFASATIVVFQPSALSKILPIKFSHQYWILNTFEELDDSVTERLRTGKYGKLIDETMTYPSSAITPLTFLNRTNGRSSNEALHALLPLPKEPKIIQFVETCAETGNSKLTPGLTLKTKVDRIEYCYASTTGDILPNSAILVIVDVTTHVTSILDQLLVILRESDHSIPVIPHISNEVLAECLRVAPPGSFIIADDFPDTTEMESHLNEVLTNMKLYNGYREWQKDFTLQTEPG